MGQQFTDALRAEVDRLSEVVKSLECALGTAVQSLELAEYERDEAEKLCHMIAAYDNHEITWQKVREAYAVWRNV